VEGKPPPAPSLPPPPQPPVPVVPPARNCPDCGRPFAVASELTDHVMSEHVSSPTPAAGVRRPGMSPALLKLISVLAIVLGVAAWVGFGIFLVSELEREPAPEQPDSVVHKIAVDLEQGGEISGFEAVEPSEGWEVEYHLGDVDFGVPDGEIRIRGEGSEAQELEIEAVNAELEDAIDDAAAERGFVFED
jgi:hypothetical protein